MTSLGSLRRGVPRRSERDSHHGGGSRSRAACTAASVCSLHGSPLTLRDVYVGRSDLRTGLSPETEQETVKPPKAALYSGPLLRFRYW
ncbi:hypothetical protein CRENBAI_000945 [Crenichthys baileyi]|uniref:Uncharacterized protein n=1 Tax=Crenichthys baileyi TaxID=28760 RepID=A0AAV9R1Z4_9TELE